MKTLFANARLIDPEAGTEGRGALLVEEGGIAAVFPEGAGLPAADETVECGGRCLAPGIIDIGVKIGEPGERHKESFRTGGLAAAAGGVTTMVTRPDTLPPIDDPETLEFVSRRAREASPVRVLPMASLTKGREGREMVEMGLLGDAGAVAFTDGVRPVHNTRLLQRALTYALGLDALVIFHPQEPVLSAGSAATAGAFASLLGLPAVPAMAEKMQLARDLALVELTGGRAHADQISTAAALPLLAAAKAQGLRVTAGANVHHLTLNEYDIADYRTFFRITPPLRPETDRVALVQAVADGLIDVIGSFHTPQDEESKRLPFEEAAPGAVGLETLLPAALQMVHSGMVSLPRLFACLSTNPARLLGLDGGRLSAGAPADLVLFDPDAPFVLDRYTLRSKSKNTPFDQRRMQGRVFGTWVGGRRVFTREQG
ncbi:amidohydrolase family protein [Paroceanicella profunda]|uniref:Amidohydrolase family protein n=1 Tax=Paroceanicella profunda TaxID=2579971 RepID=A0A5B8FQG8_9RHOB|nr:dihydroorotase [Paroceanicella profunda]QDL90635.1 amidohydrolase family protein [Paroceanicella profunda]